jgi:ribose transport system substrate-binding protein
MAAIVSLGTVSGVAAQSPSDAPADDLTVGFSIYSFATPYGKGVEQGALDAGTDLGVQVVSAGTPGFDLVELGSIIESQSAAGAAGLVAPAPDQIAVVLSGLGKPVATFDQCSPTLESLCVTQASRESGRILGREIVRLAGGPEAVGKALLGVCVPGLNILEERIEGVREGLAEAPGIVIEDTFGTEVEPSKNLPIWEQQLLANPDATILVGSCSTDTVSVGKVNAANDLRLIVGGYDVTPETLSEVEQGHAAVTIGQGTYLQGYLATRAVVESLRSGTPVPTGWLDSGTELVTAENVAMYQGFFSGEGTSPREFYAAQVEGDYTSLIRPLAEQNQ